MRLFVSLNYRTTDHWCRVRFALPVGTACRGGAVMMRSSFSTHHWICMRQLQQQRQWHENNNIAPQLKSGPSVWSNIWWLICRERERERKRRKESGRGRGVRVKKKVRDNSGGVPDIVIVRTCLFFLPFLSFITACTLSLNRRQTQLETTVHKTTHCCRYRCKTRSSRIRRKRMNRIYLLLLPNCVQQQQQQQQQEEVVKIHK